LKLYRVYQGYLLFPYKRADLPVFLYYVFEKALSTGQEGLFSA